jgi:hypothetical protein
MTVTPTIYLISRTPQGDGPEGFVDGVSAVLINLDSAVATSAALQKAEAVKMCNATKSTTGTYEDLQGANVPAQFPDNYFDTVQEIGLAAGGVLATTLNTGIIFQDVNFGAVSAIQAAVT